MADLSQSATEYDSFDIGFTLLTALLEPESFHSRSTAAEGRAHGRSFRIVLSEPETLLASRRLPKEQLPEKELPMPKLVALKRPIPRDYNLNSLETRKLRTSIAREFRILKNGSIAAHPNIVNLLGICWAPLGSGKKSLMPVLVVQAAELGDLGEFCKDERRLFPRKWFGLCIDVTTGGEALHETGIVHGDLKPQMCSYSKIDI
ncbi:serine threonine kinase [Fusarium mundagurra]|uniref:Serine threonine kinase n=1 Tax=Fusarium mundagurra TaxID=1567541 RepID=A0A8H5Z5Y8_9HYPO|nr:serine threonine kinase [Fusarium mundagurra]